MHVFVGQSNRRSTKRGGAQSLGPVPAPRCEGAGDVRAFLVSGAWNSGVSSPSKLEPARVYEERSNDLADARGRHNARGVSPQPQTSWKKRLALLAAVLFGVGGAAALGLLAWIRVAPTDASTEEGVALLTEVMNGATRKRAEALSALAGALERDPEDARAQLWFGLANLHGYLDEREMPYAIRASRAFEKAAELAPENPSAEGWRAFFEYQAAKSREEDLAGPTDALLAAADADPSFTSFLAAVSLAERSLESGLPQRTLPPLEAAEDCGDGTSWSCRTSSLFPHGAEGYHATVGDLRVRLGDLEGGQQSYRKALEMPAADRWPYRDAFESWVSAAPERAARLADDDASNDPDAIFFSSGARACASCHER